MLELLTNAWQGWQQYVSNGKYMALFLLALLFLWFRGQEEKEKVFLLYTTVVTVMCIVPVTAGFLMLYQTRYYDYQWIWNYVPITLMTAYGGTIFLTQMWEKYKGKYWKCAGVTLLLLMILLLSSSAVIKTTDSEETYPGTGREQAALAALVGTAGEQEICLWAPKQVMAAARAYDGKIRLLYGRNMWDAALGGYSYETYSPTQEMLYLWMCHAEETGELEYEPEAYGMQGKSGQEGKVVGMLDGVSSVEAARAAGVNQILLPGNIETNAVQQLALSAGAEMAELGEYYLLTLK